MSAPDPGVSAPVFAEPWHAQVFALTVSLNEAGHFAWPEWARAFSGTLRRHGLSKNLDGGDDYFIAWLETLEGFLAGRELADPNEVAVLKQAWTNAYLATPHGAPVRLPDEPRAIRPRHPCRPAPTARGAHGSS